MRMRAQVALVALTALVPLAGQAQRIEGIVLIGAARSAVQQARVFLVNNRLDVLAEGKTDGFGSFTLGAEKAGKYALLVRRTGFLPIVTERFELAEGETRTDTVFLEGRAAERSVRDAISDNLRQVFGSGGSLGMARFLGPDDIDPVREKYINLGDFARHGKLLGVQLSGSSVSGCLRFSGQPRCAQVFLDGMPVFVSTDQIMARDIEALVALRPTELGSAVTSTRTQDNSRYGAVMVYTNRFISH